MTRPLIILLCLIFFSCNDGAKKTGSFRRTDREHLSKSDDNYIKEIDNVNLIIALLNDTSELEAKHVGFTGEPSRSYAYFERLSEIAADTTLLRLTYSTNPKLRVYGMWALTKKDRELALRQLKRFEADKASLIYHAVDMVTPMSVSLLVLSRFDSVEIDRKLSE